MPGVPKVDRGSGVSFEGRWLPPPSLPVCEPAQILDGGTDRRNKDGGLEARAEARPQWPFLYSYKDGRCVINTAPHKSAYAQAEEVGVALL